MPLLKVPVEHLRFGLFIRELDRPWTDTPFVYQGFLLEREQQVEALRKHCRTVWADPEKSLEEALRQTKAAIAQASSGGDISLLPPNERLARLKAIHSQFVDGARLPKPTLYEDRTSMREELESAEPLFRTIRSLMQGMSTVTRESFHRDLPRLSHLVEQLSASIIRNPKVLLWLSRMQNRDKYTYGHLIDTAIHLMAFGRHLGFSEDSLHTVGLAGLLADIGKLDLPESILHRNGQLTAAELAAVRGHVQNSLDRLDSEPGLPSGTTDIIARHHERLDGSGYPVGLQGDAIGLFGGIAGITDVYTALTADRPYARAQSALQAFRTLNHDSGKLFHQALVEQFVQTIGLYPVGSLVELNTGDVGIVIEEHRHRRLKPRLMVLIDSQRKRCHPPVVINLLDDPPGPDGQALHITRELAPGEAGVDPRNYFQ